MCSEQFCLKPDMKRPPVQKDGRSLQLSALAGEAGGDTLQGVFHIVVAGLGHPVHEIALEGEHGLLDPDHPLIACAQILHISWLLLR